MDATLNSLPNVTATPTFSASVPTPPAAPEELADLGVLLVHGIGEQSQGETLSKFAEPVIEWIRGWLLGESPDGSSIASVPIGAQLRPPLLAPGTPAHAQVLIGSKLDGDQQVQRWLFAEAWWSPQVFTPPIASFTGWLVTRGPWLLLFHLSQWLLSAERLPQPWSRLWPWRIAAPMKVALAALVTPMWLLLSLAINSVLILASLVALIPIGRVRQAVYSLLRTLAGVVGDAYVLLRSPVQRAAFEEAALRALQWLSPRCRKLAVIGHSQGAAIAHRTLQRADAPPAELLVTVGSGIAKLEALRHFERLGAADRMSATLAPLFLVAAAVVALRSNALELSGVAVAPTALAIFGASAVLAAWASVRDVLVQLRRDSAQLALAEGLRWCDVVATHDPVPQGELTRFFDLPIVAHRVPVLRSRLSDHTSYWGARATFLPVIVDELGHCAGGTLLEALASGETKARFDAARRAVDVDLHVLRVVKGLDSAAVLLPLLAPDRLDAKVERLRVLLAAPRDTARGQSPLAFIDEALSQLEQALRWLVEDVAGGSAVWARSVVNAAAAIALLLLTLRLWQRLTFAMWQSWSANRNEAALRSPVTARKSGAELDRAVEGWQIAAMRAAVNVLFFGVLFLPFALSATWTLRPVWLDEALAYRLLAWLAGGLFVFVVVLGLVHSVAETIAPWPERWRAWRRESEPLGWPQLRDAAAQVLNLAVTVGLVLGLISVVWPLPGGITWFTAIAGSALLLHILVWLLDRIWQRLDAAGASSRRRVTLIAMAPALGLATGVALGSAVTLDSQLSPTEFLGGMAGTALFVAYIVAAATLLALHWTRRT